jgi:hypothetical protein
VVESTSRVLRRCPRALAQAFQFRLQPLDIAGESIDAFIILHAHLIQTLSGGKRHAALIAMLNDTCGNLIQVTQLIRW